MRLSLGVVETVQPSIGSIATGSLLLVENLRGKVQITPSLITLHADYLLQVRGNSMSGAGILGGNFLADHCAAAARNGQIVVARLRDEITVKRLKRRGGRTALLTEISTISPLWSTAH